MSEEKDLREIVSFEKEMVTKWLNQAREFVETVKSLIK
jgi:hypothetical protein